MSSGIVAAPARLLGPPETSSSPAELVVDGASLPGGLGEMLGTSSSEELVGYGVSSPAGLAETPGTSSPEEPVDGGASLPGLGEPLLGTSSSEQVVGDDDAEFEDIMSWAADAFRQNLKDEVYWNFIKAISNS